MATTAYQLETPRPRYNVPPPLNFELSTARSYSPFNKDNSEPLISDIHSASPPLSPRNRSDLKCTSPTSPRSGRSRKPRSGRPTPPPSGRTHSAPPSALQVSDLEKFAEQCRAWYFEQDDAAGQLMTKTLATVPPSQRAPLSRLQASVRSAYHRSVSVRKAAEFQAHLSATQPGHSLMPHTRADPYGNEARKERYQRFERFVKTWANLGMPGTIPFFQGLWAVMRLQVIPENLGGAGKNRLEWELDDAVFKEAAGKDFMLEAVDVLKGVLGFEEKPISNPLLGSTPFHESATMMSLQHSRSRSTPLPSSMSTSPEVSNQMNIVRPKRPRAPSDPFLDTPALSHSIGSSSSQSVTMSPSTDISEDPSASMSLAENSSPDFLKDIRFDFSAEEEQLIRVWTSPDLSNPEILGLLQCFPSFITRHTLPRFSAPSHPQPDVEQGLQDGNHVRCGTGSITISDRLRRDGWQGGLWTRFILWWRRIFC